MSTTSGVFSETILQNIRIKASMMAMDDRINLQYKPEIGTLNFIQKQQTANIKPIFDVKRKKKVMEVWWENACGIEVADNVNCVNGGNELSTNVEVYDLDIQKVAGFTVDEKKLYDNESNIEDLIAKGFLRADKVLSEYLAQVAVARLNAFLGINTLTVGKGTVNGTLTEIPAVFWTADLFAYLNRVAIDNRIDMPVFLSGKNLYESYWLANANAGNDNGKGDAAKFGGADITFDMRNVDAVNTPDAITYMVQRGMIAMASRTYYGPEVTDYMTEKRYAMASNFTPGLSYDIHYSTECVDDFFKHNFKVKLDAGIFKNPAGCDLTNTGVLGFKCA
jgi:hypothetical protein